MYRSSIPNSFRPRRIAGLSLLAALLVGSTPWMAATAASKPGLPVHIQANNADLSQKSGVSTYTGDVRMTRGGLTLTGSKLVVTQINNRSQVKAVLTGSPAHLDKQPDQDGNDVVTGHAHSIEYTNGNALITLRGDAVVDRGGDQVSGQVITHNVNTGKTHAERRGNSGRVRITIQPRQNQDQDHNSNNKNNRDSGPQ